MILRYNKTNFKLIKNLNFKFLINFYINNMRLKIY